MHESAYAIRSKSQTNLAKTPFKESVGGIMQSGFIEMKPSAYRFEVGFNKKYSPYIEYGTGTKVDIVIDFENYASQFIGLGIRHVKIKPHPYFQLALNEELKDLKKNLKDLLKI